MFLLKRIVKYLGYTLAALLLLAVAAFGVFYIQYPPEKIKKTLATRVSDTLGTACTIADIGYGFDMSLRLKGVKIYDTPGKKRAASGSPLLADIESLNLYLNPASVFSKLHILLLQLKGTTLYLRERNNTLNLQRYLKPAAKPGQVKVSLLTADGQLKIQSGSYARLNGKYSFTVRSTSGSSRVGLKTGDGELIYQVSRGLVKNSEPLAHGVELKNWPRQRVVLLSQKYLPRLLNGEIKMKTLPEAGYRVEVDDFKAAYQGQTYNLAGAFNLNQVVSKATLDISNKKISIRLQQGRVQKGLVSGHFKINGDLAGFFKGSRGHIKGRGLLKDNKLQQANLELRKLSMGSLFSVESLQLKGKDSQFQLANTSAVILGTPVQARGQLAEKNKKWHLQLNLTSQKISLENILKQLEQKGGAAPLVIQANVRSKAFDIFGFLLSKVETNLEVSGSSLELSGLKAAYAGGELAADYSFKNNHHNFSLGLKKLKTHKMTGPLQPLNKAFATVSGQVRGQARGRTQADLKKSLQFDARMQSGRGKISNTSLQNYLTGPLGPLDDKLATIEFDKITARIRQRNQVIYVETLDFKSYELSLKLLGKLNWQLRGEMNAVLRLHSNFVSNVARPFLLGLADQKAGPYYVLPVACNGAIDNMSCWKKQW